MYPPTKPLRRRQTKTMTYSKVYTSQYISTYHDGAPNEYIDIQTIMNDQIIIKIQYATNSTKDLKINNLLKQPIFAQWISKLKIYINIYIYTNQLEDLECSPNPP